MPIDVHEPEKQKKKKTKNGLLKKKKPLMIKKKTIFFNLVVEILILDKPWETNKKLFRWWKNCKKKKITKNY